MVRIRYMLVDHDRSHDGKLHWANKAWQHVPMMADFTTHHHWVRIDPSTIFVKAVYNDRYHKRLMTMHGTTVFPATFSRQLVSAAIQQQGNPQHLIALENVPGLGFNSATTITADLVDWFALHMSGILDHEV